MKVVLLGFFYLQLLLLLVEGYPHNKAKIPNGDLMGALGHTNRVNGGAEKNQFGMDFFWEGEVWTNALCNGDSDGDGVSNGTELGDPNCTWTQGDVPTCN